MAKTTKNKTNAACKNTDVPQHLFCNMHGIGANFYRAESFLLECFPDILALYETNLTLQSLSRNS